MPTEHDQEETTMDRSDGDRIAARDPALHAHKRICRANGLYFAVCECGQYTGLHIHQGDAYQELHDLLFYGHRPGPPPGRIAYSRIVGQHHDGTFDTVSDVVDVSTWYERRIADALAEDPTVDVNDPATVYAPLSYVGPLL